MKRPLALALAVVVHLLTLACIALGAWTIVVNAELVVGWLIGALLIALGWLLRPRLAGRLPADAEVLDRPTAGELYATAERVADRIGVRRPGKVAVRDLEPATRHLRGGLFRKPVLVVGLPLWLALSPRQRVVSLAVAYAETPTVEELLVDGALSTLGEWRHALIGAAPLRAREEAQTKVAASSLGAMDYPGTGYEVAGLFGRLIGRVLGGPVLLAEHVLTRLARAGADRVRHRRETLARRVASARELAELDRLLATGRYLAPMQAAALRGESVPAIRAGALERARLSDGVLTTMPGTELLGSAESDRIDGELLGHYTRAIRGFGLIS
ncbi:hypothetical protein [Nonomuraea sp. NPDC048916]|uniref:hypothetical protein n=1 Tax=Nonomuraea sp. NPDC048916 TaxID=3154232 RepID=UPI0033CAADAC